MARGNPFGGFGYKPEAPNYKKLALVLLSLASEHPTDQELVEVATMRWDHFTDKEIGTIVDMAMKRRDEIMSRASVTGERKEEFLEVFAEVLDADPFMGPKEAFEKMRARGFTEFTFSTFRTSYFYKARDAAQERRRKRKELEAPKGKRRPRPSMAAPLLETTDALVEAAPQYEPTQEEEASIDAELEKTRAGSKAKNGPVVSATIEGPAGKLECLLWSDGGMEIHAAMNAQENLVEALGLLLDVAPSLVKQAGGA
jgi:hypothetical protein